MITNQNDKWWLRESHRIEVCIHVYACITGNKGNTWAFLQNVVNSIRIFGCSVDCNFKIGCRKSSVRPFPSESEAGPLKRANFGIRILILDFFLFENKMVRDCSCLPKRAANSARSA